MAEVTDFGTVLPGTTRITSADCAVAFGSSNDTADLRMQQDDRYGVGMWMPTTGKLDPNFDGPSGTSNGKFSIQLDAGTSSRIVDIARQDDGKSVALGRCSTDFCLARFDRDGSLDVSFDGPSGTGDGKFILAIAGSDVPSEVVIRPDGRIAVVGSCSNQMCAMQMLPSGVLDGSFDGPSGTGNGVVTLPLVGLADPAYDAVLQPDGKLVLAGFCNPNLCLARLMEDGSLDASFDGPSGTGNGQVNTAINNGLAEGVALQPDGKIVTSGSCSSAMCFARFNIDGSFDATFDGPSGTGNGTFTITPPGSAFGRADAVALQPDGKIVAAGACFTGSEYNYCLARLNTDGSFDLTFDGPSGSADGTFMLSFTADGDFAERVIVQPDDKLLVFGHCEDDPPGPGDSYQYMCFARFHEDGSLDTQFDGPGGAGDGKFFLPLEDFDRGFAIAMQDDGRIIVGGWCSDYEGPGNIACLAQLDSGGQVDDYVTGGGSDRDFASSTSTSFFGACLRGVGGGAAATWASSGSCLASDGPTWNGLPAAPTTIASTLAVGASGSANLRFAMRAASSQPPGSYVAPVTFEVVAP